MKNLSVSIYNNKYRLFKFIKKFIEIELTIYINDDIISESSMRDVPNNENLKKV